MGNKKSIFYILGVLLTGILFSMYFFPFQFYALPDVNTKIGLAAIGLIVMAFSSAKKENNIINSDIFKLMMYAGIVSLFGLISITYNSTPDTAYATYIISFLVWLSAAFVVTYLMRQVHGYLSVDLICQFYEIAMNDEIQHPKSVYMYKDGDGKLCAGPVWDFDSQNFTNVDTEKNAYYYHTWSSLLIERAIKYNETPRRYYMWWPLLMKDQNYINRVKARWADVYPDLIDVANRVVEERRAANRLSDEYNRKIWKVGNYLDEHWLCGDENMEFDDVMDNLKYCYNKRLENLNNTITNLRKWN